MRWSIPLARFGETQVRVHLTFFLLLAWVAYAYGQQGGQAAAVQGVVFILALFGCVLLHEFGHVLAARAYGIPTPDITLLPIGGVARLARMPDDPRQELVVALAGPAVNVVIALALYVGLGGAGHLYDAAKLDTPAVSMLSRLMGVNVWLVLFNLIPAFPMDGGRVLRALLAMRLDHARATQIAASAGQTIALVFAVVGLFYNPLLILIALFIYVGAGQEAAQASFRAASRDLDLGDVMITDFRTLPATATLADAVEALIRTNQREFPIAGADGAIVGLLARERLAAGLRERGPMASVGDVMEAVPPILPASRKLEEALAAMSEGNVSVLLVSDDATGAIVGMLTPENLGEVMMVQTAADGRPVIRHHGGTVDPPVSTPPPLPVRPASPTLPAGQPPV